MGRSCFGDSRKSISIKGPLIYSGRSRLRLKYSDSPTVGAFRRGANRT